MSTLDIGVASKATRVNQLSGRFDPYVPRVASEWDNEAPGELWRVLEGSLVFVDISGFTNLSERLARKGRIGAEELTSVLNRVFGRMLEVVYDRGGTLLKFGGDALLLFFATHDHVMQACAATVEMRAALRDASKQPTSVGRINLKMSSGVHTGPVDFFLVGDSHRELIVTGPAASVTTDMEATASAGEIVVSDAVGARVPKDFVGGRKGTGWLLRKNKINHPPCGHIVRDTLSNESLSMMVPAGLRDHLASGLADSEHRFATVGFVKFNGVDRMLAVEGPERVGEELHSLVKTVQHAGDAEGITFLASDIDADGGKIIIAAGIPVSQHDDEGRVLRAARQILDSDLELDTKIGVNRGHVFAGNVGTDFRRTYTVMGDTVNLAARLMSAADHGRLYASPSVLNLSSTLFRTEALEPFLVKGKEQPVQAYAVFEETGVRPPELAFELPFRGRDAELETIVGIVNTCSRVGRGGMMTISGRTGVGKSRLIAEVLERCSGMDTVTLQAEPNGIDNPYWAFRDPIRRQLGIERAPQAEMRRQLLSAIVKTAPELEWALPLLGDVTQIQVDDNEQTSAIEPRFRPERTADALIDLLSAGHTRPIALVVEDGQWLDDASLGLIKRIGEAAKTRPWTVLITARAGQGDFQPLGDEIELAPLEEPAVRSIVVETTQATPLRPHSLDAVVARADGNPLFLGEILRVIKETGNTEELPDSLDAVISTEIDTLPALARRLLRYSSVLGRSFRRVVLDEFLSPEQIHIDAATERELSRFIDSDDEGRMRFRHAVVHNAAYEGLTYGRRRELHGRAGNVIERQAGDDPEAVAEYLATHYSQSGEYERAWKYARIAADKAKRAYANAEAAAQYRRAIEASRWIEVGNEQRAEIQELLGDVLDRLGAFDEALGSYRRAQHGYRDPQSQARVLFVQAVMLQRMGELSRALRTLTRGLELANAHDVTDVAVDILAQRASIRQYQGRYHEAVDLAQQALTRAGEGASSAQVAVAEMISDWAKTALGAETDYSDTWRALQIAEEIGDLHVEAAVLNNLGMFAYYAGDWDEAVELYARGSDSYHKTGDAIAAAYGQANTAEILSEQGHLDEAEAQLAEVLPVFRAAGDLRVAAFVLTHQARIRIRRGEIDPALQHFEQAMDIYAAMGASSDRIEVMLRRAEAMVIAGRVGDARLLLDETRELSPGQVPVQLTSLALRVHGLTTWAEGDRDGGSTYLRRALTAARDVGSGVDEVAAVHALGATGTVEPAWTDRAAELCEQLGIISVPIYRVR
jgi:class 3 adenylate cyclase/tetratricopeptide (TPR) repeat protein